MLKCRVLLARMTRYVLDSPDTWTFFQKPLVWRAVNQIDNVIQAVSIAPWQKKRYTIKTPLLQLSALASHTWPLLSPLALLLTHAKQTKG